MKFETGDIVRIGKGKVEYTVLTDVVTSEAHIESKNTGKAQTVDASRLSLIRKAKQTPDLEHVPGETPAEYKARTGKKLDGRITSYGRAILLALQPKLHLQGAKRPRRSKIMARKPQSK